MSAELAARITAATAMLADFRAAERGQAAADWASWAQRLAWALTGLLAEELGAAASPPAGLTGVLAPGFRTVQVAPDTPDVAHGPPSRRLCSRAVWVSLPERTC